MFAEFHADHCLFKDKNMKRVLLQGILKGGLYQLDVSKLEDGFKLGGSVYNSSLCNNKSKECSLSFVSNVSLFSGTGSSISPNNVYKRSTGASYVSGSNSVSSPHYVVGDSNCAVNSMLTCKLANLWHSRLGHPSKRVLHDVLSTLKINESAAFDFCSSCQFGKSHKLPFVSSELHTTSVLNLVHADVWGPSPVLSVEGYRYYICFIDDFIRFSWIYPMKVKSEAKAVFIKFQNFVERQFNCKIKSLQTDWGGEFRSLLPLLDQLGVLFRHPCPYVHEQNGKVERKHRHVVETGLTLLAQAVMPLTYWWTAFSSAVYLINRLPTSTLHMVSPFEAIYHKKPDYLQLKVFGYSCYPYLRPYNKHKLQFRSSQCIFMGYSSSHKGY